MINVLLGCAALAASIVVFGLLTNRVGIADLGTAILLVCLAAGCLLLASRLILRWQRRGNADWPRLRAAYTWIRIGVLLVVSWLAARMTADIVMGLVE
ncbi:MAG: hypothetical protein AAF270_02715 [Pseudomonadota bacterium]